MANRIRIMDCKERLSCKTCVKGKLKRLSFSKKSTTQPRALLDLIHSDLCGSMQTQTPSGKRYMMTLIDDFSPYYYIYLLTRREPPFAVSDSNEKV